MVVVVVFGLGMNYYAWSSPRGQRTGDAHVLSRPAPELASVWLSYMKDLREGRGAVPLCVAGKDAKAHYEVQGQVAKLKSSCRSNRERAKTIAEPGRFLPLMEALSWKPVCGHGAS
ncbi:hypothetical protein QAD02_010432 [Eretmocerus hayati]|uniref:Uncharacterized protein n=1 Tax=Eretmocerus hayati TaxID=131215 RepID=A0ACC2NU02_9HYME|nr:hypothetical protein QAD02_010432 [Eretmocerus hayati]